MKINITVCLERRKKTVLSVLICFCFSIFGGWGGYGLSRLFHLFWAKSVVRWGWAEQRDDKRFRVLKISFLTTQPRRLPSSSEKLSLCHSATETTLFVWEVVIMPLSHEGRPLRLRMCHYALRHGCPLRLRSCHYATQPRRPPSSCELSLCHSATEAALFVWEVIIPLRHRGRPLRLRSCHYTTQPWKPPSLSEKLSLYHSATEAALFVWVVIIPLCHGDRPLRLRSCHYATQPRRPPSSSERLSLYHSATEAALFVWEVVIMPLDLGTISTC